MLRRFRSGDQVHWWKKITSDVEHPYRAVVISTSSERLKIAIADETDKSKRIIRHVSASRIQPIATYFAKASNQGPAILAPADSWGKFVRYLEIGEDLHAVRQIDVFPNGEMLSYDRHHWIDDYGAMGEGRVNRNRKEGPWGRSREIARDEFERIWKQARRSSTWKRQQATARMERFGPTPVWLTIRSWRRLL